MIDKQIEDEIKRIANIKISGRAFVLENGEYLEAYLLPFCKGDRRLFYECVLNIMSKLGYQVKKENVIAYFSSLHSIKSRQYKGV